MSASHRQSQFELFPSKIDRSAPREPARSTPRELKLASEHMVILGVFVIFIMVASFSLGVERGKTEASLSLAQAKWASRAVEPRPVRRPAAAAMKRSASEEVEEARAAEPAPAADPAPKTVDESGPKKGVDKLYTIQVASFRKERTAKKEALALAEKGFEAHVMPKGKWSIVCVGKFAGKGEAKAKSRELRKIYKDNLIRSL